MCIGVYAYHNIFFQGIRYPTPINIETVWVCIYFNYDLMFSARINNRPMAIPAEGCRRGKAALVTTKEGSCWYLQASYVDPVAVVHYTLQSL